MHSHGLSLISKSDIGLTKSLCWLLRSLKTGCLWLFGLLVLVPLPWILFEYGEGLADISLLEWGFMPLLFLLLWRHVHYCRHFSTGVWRGLSRLLIYQGLMIAVELVITGLFISLLLHTEHLTTLLGFLMRDDPISKFITFGTILLAVYLAAPTTATSKGLPMPRASSPEASTMAKEAAQ